MNKNRLFQPKFLVSDVEEWKRCRGEYLTSTDVAAVLGLDKYKTANQVRQTKIHGPEDPTIESQVYFDLGHKWEPHVLSYGMRALNLEDKLLHTQGFYTLEDVKLASTPDSVFSNGVLIEAKCTGMKNRKYWRQSPPIKYVVQAQVQMMTTNANTCYLVGMFFDPWPEGEPAPMAAMIYEIKKSARLQKKILDFTRNFWHYISMEDRKYVVSSFEKEENMTLASETATYLREEEFDAYMPRNALTSNDLQIIRQVALEAAVKHMKEVAPANTVLNLAEEFMVAYLNAIDGLAQVYGDPTSKGAIIALQSAMKRVAELEVPLENAANTMVMFALFTLTGERN